MLPRHAIARLLQLEQLRTSLTGLSTAPSQAVAQRLASLAGNARQCRQRLQGSLPHYAGSSNAKVVPDSDAVPCPAGGGAGAYIPTAPGTSSAELPCGTLSLRIGTLEAECDALQARRPSGAPRQRPERKPVSQQQQNALRMGSETPEGMGCSLLGVGRKCTCGSIELPDGFSSRR